MGIIKSEKKSVANRHLQQADPISNSAAGFDATLDALFQTSLNTSKRVPEKQPHGPDSADSVGKHVKIRKASNIENDAELADSETDLAKLAAEGFVEERPRKKRKRKAEGEDIEEKYFRRLDREQERFDAKQHNPHGGKEQDQPPPAVGTPSDTTDPLLASAAHEGAEPESPSFDIPKHETVAAEDKDDELEKAKRTVFLSNVAISAIAAKPSRRQLLDHLSSFFDDMDKEGEKSKIESLRFRSTAYASNGMPKKASYARKEVMDATMKSTNAYVVYSTAQAAREAVRRLNATVVLERYLRVDSVAHPLPVDNRRCVFVGNLGFVDDDSLIRAAETEDGKKVSKKRHPGDVEEGLWRQFMKAGEVESVRVVRDKETRVGKGFAYVQFKDQNAVEKALAFHEKRYPPLLPRTLRVTRAKNMAKTASQLRKSHGHEEGAGKIYNPRHSAEELSKAGRARKLFGKSGSLALEGNRARRGQAPKLGKGASKKKAGKPQTRSSRRGAAYKASKQG